MKLRHVADYSARRAAKYPSLGDQLDMLWHAMDTGQLPKIEPMYSQVKAVKAQFPKVAPPNIPIRPV